MPVVFNLTGLGLVLLAGLVMTGTQLIFEISALSLIAGGAAGVIGDLSFRYRDGFNWPTLLSPKEGGHIWFLPIWFWGVVVGSMAIVRSLNAT